MRLSMHDFNRFTRESGISLAQMNILLHLHYRGPLEVTSFCEMMQISPAGASQMIERMAQQGFVRRSEAPADRRVRLVSLTEQGQEIVLKSIEARQAWIAQLTAALTPAEQARIVDALRTLNERASQLQIEPV
jgi:DNA-binding MarR family transcriptional regulator